MAKKKWLTQANRYNFKNIKKPNYISYLDPTTFGIGNTRVTIPAMQDANGEAIALDEKLLVSPNIKTTPQGSMNKYELVGWNWKPQNSPDLWAWAIPSYTSIPSTQRIINDSDPLRNQSVDKANDKDWTPHKKTYLKSTFIKDFTSAFYDLTTNHIGLDLDMSIDDTKINASGPQTQNASDYLVFKPIFRLNALTQDALNILTIPKTTKKSTFFNFFTGNWNKWSDGDYIDYKNKEENFDLDVSNILFNQKKISRKVFSYSPLFDISNKSSHSTPNGFKTLINDVVIWENIKNEYSYGTLDIAVAKNNTCSAARLVLRRDLVCSFKNKQYSLISPNKNISRTIDSPIGGTKLCSLTDFTLNEKFDSDLTRSEMEWFKNPTSETAELLKKPKTYEKISVYYQSKPYLKNALKLPISDRSDKEKVLVDIQTFNNLVNPQWLSTKAPAPYNSVRAVGTCNQSVSVVDCKVVNSNNRLGITLESNLMIPLLESNLKIFEIDLAKSDRTPVLYVRSSIIVSLDALAKNLRGQKFECLYDDIMEVSPIELYQHPLVVKQNDANQFVEIILERVFDLTRYQGGKFFTLLNEVDRKLQAKKNQNQAVLLASKTVNTSINNKNIASVLLGMKNIKPIDLGLLKNITKRQPAFIPLPPTLLPGSGGQSQVDPNKPYLDVIAQKGVNADQILGKALDLRNVTIPNAQDKLFLIEFIEMLDVMASSGYIPQDAIIPLVGTVIEPISVQEVSMFRPMLAQTTTTTNSPTSTVTSAPTSTNQSGGASKTKFNVQGMQRNFSKIKLFGLPLSGGIGKIPAQPPTPIRVKLDLVRKYNIDKTAVGTQVPFRINELIFGEIIKQNLPTILPSQVDVLPTDIPPQVADVTGSEVTPSEIDLINTPPTDPSSLEVVVDTENSTPMEGDLPSTAPVESKTPWGWIAAGVATVGVAGAIVWNMNRKK